MDSNCVVLGSAQPKTVVALDITCVYFTAKRLGISINYRALKNVLCDFIRLPMAEVKFIGVTASVDSNKGQQIFLGRLENEGIQVSRLAAIPGRSYYTAELVAAAMLEELDEGPFGTPEIVLVTSDPSIVACLDMLGEAGIECSLAYFSSDMPAMVAKSIERGDVATFYDLDAHLEELKMDPERLRMMDDAV